MNRWAIVARPYGTFQVKFPAALVTYRFDDPGDDIYATLVVRLYHAVEFQCMEIWKSAADFNQSQRD